MIQKSEVFLPTSSPCENGVRILDGEVDITPWVHTGLFDPLYVGMGGLVITCGTPTRLLVPHFQVVHVNKLERSGTAVLFGGSFSEGDNKRINGIRMAQASSKRVYNGDLYANKPERQRIVLAEFKPLNSMDGFGGQRELAEYVMRVDPTVRKAIENAVNKARQVMMAHKNLGGTALKYNGFGGHSKVLERVFERIQEEFPINWVIDVYLGPTSTQTPNRINAKHDLERIIGESQAENVLNVFVPQKRRGYHDTDLILAGGLETLQASDQFFGDEDKENLFRSLRRQGRWVVAKPIIVKVKLETIGRFTKKWYWFRPKEERYEVNPTDSAGGNTIRLILSTIHNFINARKDAFYLVVILGAFDDQERDELIEMIPSLIDGAAPGQIIPIVNRMKPAVDALGNAEYGVVVFEGAAETPSEVTDLLSYTPFQGHR